MSECDSAGECSSQSYRGGTDPRGSYQSDSHSQSESGAESFRKRHSRSGSGSCAGGSEMDRSFFRGSGSSAFRSDSGTRTSPPAQPREMAQARVPRADAALLTHYPCLTGRPERSRSPSPETAPLSPSPGRGVRAFRQRLLPGCCGNAIFLERNIFLQHLKKAGKR